MNRSGAGPQALRSIPQNVYGTQPTSNRNSPMASQRLQNGKLGNGSSWGFGMPMAAGAPGLQNSRPAPLSNFAQAAMGGASASQAPLDLSEFPSLSGGPGGPSQPSNVPQAWNSTAIRQQPAVQRPQQPTQARVLSGQHQQLAMDSQFDGQSAGASRSANNQNQAQSATGDFPPLGGQMNGERRRQAPGLNGLGQMNGQADQTSDALRSPSESYHTTASLQDAQEAQARQRNPSNPQSLDQQNLPYRDNMAPSQQQAPIGQPNAAPQPPQQQQQSQQHPNFDTPEHHDPQMINNAPTASQQQAHDKQMSEMTESEAWGLPGLMAKIHNNTFFQGQELTQQELDLENPEPLYPMWATPFTNANSQRIIPDFTLPDAYSVNNVPPIHSRITAFTDDTLFAIFYQFTRDVLQEVAAGELYARDWRWHKQLRQWMMKDTSLAQPVRVSERSERGFYIFFDANNWRRERREYVLSYDDLDQRHGSAIAAGQPGGI